MNNPTAAQVAALAELFGITPETHPYCFKVEFHHEYCGPAVSSNVRTVTPQLPDPLGPDADGVWAVPIMAHLQSKGYLPYITGRDPEHSSNFSAGVFDDLEYTRYGATMTAALLQACLAARVPEVCGAMEGER